jgi:hypothetical protein
VLADPLVTSYSFERSRPCPQGGSLTVAGSGTTAWDADVQSFDVEASGTNERAGCAFARGDAVFTVTGSGEWTHSRGWLDRRPAGSWVTTQVGDVEWSKSTGEGGQCTFTLLRTLSTGTSTITLTGTFCGQEIDRTFTWGS